MDDPVVSVRGEAVLEVEPEIAQVTVAVGARDKHRDDTLRRLDERSAAVLALVESFGSAVEQVQTDRVRIGPEFKDGKPGERIQGYSAGIRHTLTVVDFTALGDLVIQLADREMVDVDGPWWRLRPASDRHREARMVAARDAVTRAREYAEALGSRLTALVELADTGLMSEHADRPFPVAPAAAPMAMRSMASSSAPRPVTLDLEPVRQVVRANVEARFRLAQPADERLR